MNNFAQDHSKFDIKQIIKAVVYTILLFNFGYYIWLDISVAQHTLFEGSNFGEKIRAFATTIDLSAWIVLIAVYELETYTISDAAFTKTKVIILNFVKLLCLLSIAHTPYAYYTNLMEILSAVEISGVSDLCELAGLEKSYAYNIKYAEITSESCGSLSSASQFFYSDPRTLLIVQDEAGLVIERQLAKVDLAESIAWIIIIFAIEANVRLQDKNLSSGTVFSFLKYTKAFSYSVLWIFCVYWIYRGHYFYSFDEMMWIAGFFAIEMNLSDWRKEIGSDATDNVILK